MIEKILKEMIEAFGLPLFIIIMICIVIGFPLIIYFFKEAYRK